MIQTNVKKIEVKKTSSCECETNGKYVTASIGLSNKWLRKQLRIRHFVQTLTNIMHTLCMHF